MTHSVFAFSNNHGLTPPVGYCSTYICKKVQIQNRRKLKDKLKKNNFLKKSRV